MRDLKTGGIKGVPFVEIADRALEAEKADNDILDEERVIRERQARQAHQNFRPGYQGGRDDRLRYNVLRMQKGR